MDRTAYMKQYRADYKARMRRVSLTLSHADYAGFERVARRDGKPVTTVVHEHAIAALVDEPYIADAVEKELAALRFQISNISNNINQLTHHSHIVRQFTEEGALLEELRRLQNVIEAHTRKSLRGFDDH